MKLIPHPTFDPHLEASAQRDNVQIADKVDSKNPLFKLSLSKDAVRRYGNSILKNFCLHFKAFKSHFYQCKILLMQTFILFAD